MKNFASLALLACYAQAQNILRTRDETDQEMESHSPEEPDNFQFPQEWREGCSAERRDLCEHSWEEVIKYDDEMMRDYEQNGKCTVTHCWVPKRAYCRM